MQTTKATVTLIVGLLLAVSTATYMAHIAKAAAGQNNAGPTKENALAADQELARAIRENDADGIQRLLDSHWAVISATGGVGEGPSIFPGAIKAGVLTRKSFEISEPRVVLYGDVALVTTKVVTSGTFQSKPFDVTERQTDALVWRDGMWKCVLSHETKIKDNQ